MSQEPTEAPGGTEGGDPGRFGALAWLLWAFLPGALAGTQLTGLLFFLNPHLPFDPLSVASGVAFYGSLLGGVSLVLALLFLHGHRDRLRRWVPIALTAVLAVAGLGAWIHASKLAFYLPPGINRRLLKAAILLSLAALICFYTVLLHRLHHRPYGRRSRTLLALTALASIYVVMERREAFRPALLPAPRPTIFQGSQRPQLCVVGIESATLDAILPLEEQGRLPFFGKMLREGAHARLSTLRPTRRAALWTTLATGKYPYRHGVVGDHIFDVPFLPGLQFHQLPLGVGFERWGTWSRGRPADASASRARMLWEILSRLGVPTALVGWPQTVLPAADVHQALAERFFESGGEAWFAQPADLAERARLFRTRVDEIDPAVASRFGPRPPAEVLAALTRDLWRQDLSFFLLDQNPQIEALFVVLPGLAEISSRYFGGYSAVQFDGLQEEASVHGARLVSAYYTYLDDVLAQLWERGGEPRMLVIVSASGAAGPEGWRRGWRLFRQGTVEGHLDLGSDGILMFLGEGVQPGSIRPAELVDLVPTLLYSLGFPIARDLDGAVLTTAFETAFLARQPLTFLPSYEALAESTDR